MKRLSSLLNRLVALLVLAVPSAVWALEQGFAIEANSEVELRVNGVAFSGSELDELFTVERVGAFDRYIARRNAFDGSETLMVSAYAVDDAGNRSLELTQLALATMDTTAPQTPEVTQLANRVSEDYSGGFMLPTGSIPILIVNGLAIESDNVTDWFDVDATDGADYYTPRSGLFDGSERVDVSAYRVDGSGNESHISDAVSLLPIDTLSPSAPRILTLDQLLAESESSAVSIDTVAETVEPDMSESEFQNDIQMASSVDLAEAVEVIEATELAEVAAGAAVAEVQETDVSQSVSVTSAVEDLDAIVASILEEPIESTVEAVRKEPELAQSAELPESDVTRAVVPNIVASERSRGVELDTEIHPEPLSLIQTDVPGDMLAATNGLDPFEILNLEVQTLEVRPETIAKQIPPRQEQPRTQVFDLKTPEDTQRLIDWMRLESTTISCSMLETADGGSLHEILDCLDRLGYPQAQMDETPEGIRIDTGEKMVIESVGVHQVLDPSLALSLEFLADLESQPMSKSRHVKAIERLDQLGFVRNGSFDYYARAPGLYDAELVGEAGESQLSLGASLTTGAKLFGALDGRHFFDYQGLRYLDYRVGSDVDGQYEIDLAAPLFYNLNNQFDLEFKTAPAQFRFFDSRSTSLTARWRDFTSGDSLHLSQVRVSAEQHEFSPKPSAVATSSTVDNQAVLEAQAQLEAKPGWTEGDGVTLSIGLGQNFERGSTYARTDIEYDTGAVAVADTEFSLRARISGSHLAGDLKEIGRAHV